MAMHLFVLLSLVVGFLFPFRIEYRMDEDHASVRVKIGRDPAVTAGRRLDSRLANIIGHKRFDQFISEIGGHQGLLQLLDVHQEGHASGVVSHFRGGILASSVQNRQMQFGSNKLPQRQSKSLWDFIRESVEDDRILQLLIGSAILSIVLGVTTPDYRDGKVDLSTGWIEGAAIIVSIVIVITVNAVNNYKKQKQFLDVMAREDRARRPLLVWRYDQDGDNYTLRSREIRSEDVVVGDVVQLSAGMELSFDAILFDGHHIICDECSVTGENDDVIKHIERDPYLISGSSVLDGSSEGIGVVCAVGERSFAGEIAMTIDSTDKKNSPLQDQLEEMAERIGKFGFGAAIITFVALLVKELYSVIFYRSAFFAMKFFENLTTAIAIVVVAVPEGLPLSVTISLAYSMRRMMQDGNLVRHLAACETMGGATVFCTDKTGTITAPNMELARVFFEGRTHERSSDNRGVAEEFITATSSKVASLLINCIVANSADPETGRARNKTGDVLMQLRSCIRVGTSGREAFDKHFLKEANDMLSLMRDEDQCVRFPFNSFEKKCTSVVRLGEKVGLREYVSGAPEVVLSKCANVVIEDGRLDPLTNERRQYYENILRSYNQSGFRTVCCAYGDDNSITATSMPVMPLNTSLNLLAIIALEEVIRPEVPRSLEACARAGLRVIMITGDAPLTAVNIANRCGLLRHITDMDTSSAEDLMRVGVVMDGQIFRSLSDTELLDKCIASLCVLARATPLDKKRVLQLLRKYDPLAVVAVTGDGTNDAPALKMSDVGFAMNSGSDVAKRASDIVLLNDNFSGMVKATMWGRNVKDNIRKFLQFQLTVNGVACIVAFLGALMSEQNLSPLKPVQLLWINLIMDTMAALALATELPSEAVLLSRPPELRSTPVILPSMWFQVVTQGTFQLVSQLYMLSAGHKFFPSEKQVKGDPYIERFGPKHLCIVFNLFVLMQVMNFFNARLLNREERFFGRWKDSIGLLFIVTVIVLVQVGIVQFGGRFMSTVPLSFEEWFFCTACASGSLVVGFISRMLWWGKNPECGKAPPATWFQRCFVWRRSRNGQKASE